MKKLYTLLVAATLMAAGTVQAMADETHPWAGTYTLMVSEDTYLNTSDSIAALYGITYPDTFDITIEWVGEEYRITKFMSYDLKDMANGGVLFTATDDKYGTITTKSYVLKYYKDIPADTTIVGTDTTIVARDYDALVLWGDGSSNLPVSVEKQSDGQISIGGFCLSTASIGRGGTTPSGWYYPCTPLNGGDVKETYDWVGYYKVTASFVYAMDGGNYPETFLMEIKEDDWGNLYVAQFAGYETGEINWNALYVVPNDKDGDKATIDNSFFNTLVTLDAETYTNLVLLDSFGAQEGIALTHNGTDETISIDYFNIGKQELFGTPETVCYYLGATAVKITEEEADAISAPEASSAIAPTGTYNLSGQSISAPRKGQIIIRDGKKTLAE